MEDNSYSLTTIAVVAGDDEPQNQASRLEATHRKNQIVEAFGEETTSPSILPVRLDIITTDGTKITKVHYEGEGNDVGIVQGCFLRFHRFLGHLKRPRQRIPSQYQNSIFTWIDNFFGITSAESTLLTEIIGGFTTFLTCAYIMNINPVILGTTGMNANAVFVVTALISGLASMCMGFLAGVPIVIAPSMGMNSFFAFTLVPSYKFGWETGLGIQFIASLLSLFVVIFAVRKTLILALPEFYRIGLAVGIGLFLALIGTRDMKLVEADSSTMISLAPITWRMGVSVLSLLFLCAFVLRRIRLGFVITIISTCFIVVILRAIFERDELSFGSFGNLNISDIVFKLRFHMNLDVIYIIPLIVFVHLFDAVSTILVLIRAAYFSNLKCRIEFTSEDLEGSLANSLKVRDVLLIDGFFFILSSLLGTSGTTCYIESASGIAVGARTGLASMVTGFLFIISIFVRPIITFIAPEATGPALVATAMILIPFLRYLDFEKYEQVFPALFTMIMIPYAYSIGTGAAFGYVFMLILPLAGKFKQVTWLMWFLIFLSILNILTNLFGQLKGL